MYNKVNPDITDIKEYHSVYLLRLGPHNHAFSLSSPVVDVKKNRYVRLIHFILWTYWPSHRTLDGYGQNKKLDKRLLGFH